MCLYNRKQRTEVSIRFKEKLVASAKHCGMEEFLTFSNQTNLQASGFQQEKIHIFRLEAKSWEDRLQLCWQRART
ncbi:Uncharacterized protein APZ42_018735 [Daphnia magna]|uniref:Uncharacterized protein n=1 Tax=Daphnia magna TaxID=35525 RepID=A0A164YSF8_9CRUS|nr:Uncharacterized protein APZ42_018735 [Daphnia magna]